MAWTQAQLAAAFNMISPVPATLVAACATLNAQTTTQTIDVPISSVESYFLVNGIWPALQKWAAANPSDTTGVLATIQSLEALLSSPNLQTVQMTDSATATAVEGMLSTLVTASLLTSAQKTAILAIASQTVSTWNEPVQPAHLQMAQRAGLINASIPVS